MCGSAKSVRSGHAAWPRPGEPYGRGNTPASHTPGAEPAGAHVRQKLHEWEGMGLSSASSPVRSRLRSRRWPALRCSGNITRKQYSAAEGNFRNLQTGVDPLVRVVPARAAPSERSGHRFSPVGGKEPCHVDRAGIIADRATPFSHGDDVARPTRRHRRRPPQGRDGVNCSSSRWNWTLSATASARSFSSSRGGGGG